MATELDLDFGLDEPRDAVFDLMADCSNEAQWNPDVLEVKRIDDGPLAAGAEWDGRYKGLGTMHIRLDEYERPSRLKFTTTGNKMDMQWTFEYSSPAPSSTHVDAHAVVAPKGGMKLMSPLVGPMMRRTFSKRPAQLVAGLRASSPVATGKS